MAKSTNYLYGVDPKTFMDLSYKEALNFKIDKAKELLGVLLEHGYMECDRYRVNYVYKAIKFNESLLKELECH
jgi:hypothetical protein